MKKLYTLLLLVITSITFGQQPTPFYEGFNYTAPGILQTQPGWFALNTGDDLVIASGNLSYVGLPASTGNKVTFGGAGIDASKEFASLTTNTVYYSFLLNATDLTNVTSTTGTSTFNNITTTGVITGAASGNIIPFLFANQTAFRVSKGTIVKLRDDMELEAENAEKDATSGQTDIIRLQGKDKRRKIQ